MEQRENNVDFYMYLYIVLKFLLIFFDEKQYKTRYIKNFF